MQRELPASFNSNLYEFFVEDMQPREIECKEIRGHGDWGLAFAPGSYIAFGVVTFGKCYVRDDTERAVQLSEGDFLLRAPDAGWALTETAHACARGAFSPPLNEPAIYQVGSRAEPVSTRISAGHVAFADQSAAIHRLIAPGLMVRSGNSAEIRRLLGALSEETQDRTSISPTIRKHLVQLLLLASLRARPVVLGSATQPPALTREQGIVRVLNAMRAQPEADWSLAKLAAMAFMSRSVFARRFELVVGQPPLQYLRKLRMQKAKAALRSGLSLKEVAEKTGYRSGRSLSDAFRRTHGKSPIDYRKTPLNGLNQDEDYPFRDDG